MTAASGSGSREKHPESVPELLSSLRHLRETNPKAVRSTVHIYPASIYLDNGDDGEEAGANARASASSEAADRRITSWKMTEHMYFNASNPFPTLARGLFTEELEEGSLLPPSVKRIQGMQDRIVARGYDKFFNIDEVEWTNWEAMKHHTQAPYYLTLKSNGCLILISALSPSHLMVASKHSLGTTTEAQESEKANTVDALADGLSDLSVDPKAKGKAGKGKGKEGASRDEKEEEGEQEARQHAEVGRDWLRRTLKGMGKTEAQLARRLWDDNLTAVLELCDDSFEEHVIATPEHWTGLHLHGLNSNTPHFATLPPSDVTAFAHEFGFIPTKSVELQTLDEVKSFTDEVAKTGSWEGDQIEGFVVRSTVKPPSEGPVHGGRPPYRTGAPFFFKVKFEEPYLLYRQWREITRVMLPLLETPTPAQEADVWKKVRSRVKRPEVAVYADWVGEVMKKEPKLFEGYERGVVRVRERFLDWTEKEGSKSWAEAKAGKYKLRGNKVGRVEPERDVEKLPKKWLLVPVAVPGCGKTLIGLALSHLFGFGHTQSDDVTAKRTAPTFLKNIAALLQKKDVVFADRNNHIEKHYNELADLAKDKSLKAYNLRLVAIVWDIDSQPYHRLLRICSERVVTRGDNHQTLRPDPTAEAEHEAIVGQFLRNFTTPDPSLFDRIIEVKVDDAPREAIRKIVDGFVGLLGVQRPSDEAIDQALKAAEGYKVTTPYHAPAKISKAVRYFGLAPEIDITALVDEGIAGMSKDLVDSAKTFFEDLKVQKRVAAKPHVTLAHEKNVEAEKDAAGGDAAATAPGPQEMLWNTCKALAESKVPQMFNFNLTHLVWDDRVMALVLDDLHPQSTSASTGGDSAMHITLDLPREVKAGLHVTVGTRTEEISAFESRGITRLARERMMQGEREGEAEEAVEGGGKVKWAKIGPLHGEGRVRGMS